MNKSINKGEKMIKIVIPMEDLEEIEKLWKEKSALYKKQVQGEVLTADEASELKNMLDGFVKRKVDRVEEFYGLVLSFERLKTNDIKEVMKKDTLRSALKPFFIDLKGEMEVDKNTLNDIMDYIEKFIKEEGVQGSWAAKHIRLLKSALEN
jgi:hypothetical protein